LKGDEKIMKVTIWKNEKESNERCITRFNKKVQASRKILKIRNERYHTKPKTKRYARKAAVMRDHYRAAKEKNKFY
jgi:ribosomal protein S21